MLALFGGRSRGIARIGCAALRCPFAFTRSTAEGARAYTADNSINQRPSLGHSQVSNHGLSVLFIGSGGFSTAVLSNLERYFRHKDTVIGGLEVMCKRPHVFIRDRNPEVKKVPAHIEASVRGLQLHYFDPKVSLPWSAPRPKQSELGRFDIAVMCTDAPKLPKTFIDGFPLGVLRVHPSLLPKHRGGAPIQAALLAGDSVTGVTIAEHSAEDTYGGRILAQVPHELEWDDRYENVKDALAKLGGKLLAKVMHNLDFVRSQAVDQDMSKATYTRAIEGEDARRIEWETMSAAQIFNLFRSCPEHTPLHTIWRQANRMQTLNILDMHLPSRMVPPLSPQLATKPPGSMFFSKKAPYIEVPCIDGSRIHISRFLMEGKTEKLALEFVNGYLREQGEMRMLSTPVTRNKPTPDFVYPPGHRLYVDPEVKKARLEARHTAREAAKAKRAKSVAETVGGDDNAETTKKDVRPAWKQKVEKKRLRESMARSSTESP